MQPLSTQEPAVAEFIVFYEGLVCGLRGRTIAEAAAGKMHDGVTINLRFWSLGILAIPEVCSKVGHVCRQADIIILAVPRLRRLLAGEGQQFVEWLSTWDLSDCLLILDANEHAENASPPMIQDEVVRHLREKLGVPCLPTFSTPDDSCPSWLLSAKDHDPGLSARRVERAQPHHRWGINE